MVSTPDQGLIVGQNREKKLLIHGATKSSGSFSIVFPPSELYCPGCPMSRGEFCTQDECSGASSEGQVSSYELRALDIVGEDAL